jgi:hypothetical protein
MPQGYSHRVANETLDWERGNAWVFNDSIDYEVFNPTD